MPDSPRTFELLREYIAEQCGVTLGEDKNYLIESRLAKLLVENECADFDAFYWKARGDRSGVLRDRIVDAMTTHETLWFRDEKVWDVIRDVMLASWMREMQKGVRRRVRIWSAACSTGQEAYSMAMLADEVLAGGAQAGGLRPADVEILATDISDSARQVAAAGRYNGIAMSRGLSEARKVRYFREDRGVWELRPEIRERVRFQRLNLRSDFGGLGGFDLILVRNVAIYFSESLKKDLFERVARQQAPRGFLVLGSAESLSGYTSAYRMMEQGKAIYYQAKL